jgi:hypothetical protein
MPQYAAREGTGLERSCAPGAYSVRQIPSAPSFRQLLLGDGDGGNVGDGDGEPGALVGPGWPVGCGDGDGDGEVLGDGDVEWPAERDGCGDGAGRPGRR